MYVHVRNSSQLRSMVQIFLICNHEIWFVTSCRSCDRKTSLATTWNEMKQQSWTWFEEKNNNLKFFFLMFVLQNLANSPAEMAHLTYNRFLSMSLTWVITQETFSDFFPLLYTFSPTSSSYFRSYVLLFVVLFVQVLSCRTRWTEAVPLPNKG